MRARGANEWTRIRKRVENDADRVVISVFDTRHASSSQSRFSQFPSIDFAQPLRLARRIFVGQIVISTIIVSSSSSLGAIVFQRAASVARCVHDAVYSEDEAL